MAFPTSINSLCSYQMNDLEYSDLVAQAIVRFGWRQLLSPAAMIDQWAGFVSECENGYSFSLFEFKNDRSIRDLVEFVMFFPLLWDCDQTMRFRESVEAVDRRYRACCRVDVTFPGSNQRWWQSCVPCSVEGEFELDLRTEVKFIPVV
jgi:hypothetical protein